VLEFQITYRGIKIGTYVTHVYMFIYYIVQYFFYKNVFVYNTDKKKIITQNIHTNCFRWY